MAISLISLNLAEDPGLGEVSKSPSEPLPMEVTVPEGVIFQIL